MSAAERLREVPDVEGRVRHIRELMARGCYQRGVTSKQLAAEWGLAVDTVEGHAAEASRQAKALVDAAAVRLRLANALDEALDHARGTPGDVAKVSQAYAPLVGANAAQKHEVALGLSPELEATLGRLKQLPEERRMLAFGALEEVVACIEAGEAKPPSLGELLADAKEAAERAGHSAVVALLDEAMAMTERASVEEQ